MSFQITRAVSGVLKSLPYADVAQLVERQLPKLEVAGSKPVVRSFVAISFQRSALFVIAVMCCSVAASGCGKKLEFTLVRYVTLSEQCDVSYGLADGCQLTAESYLPLILRMSHLAGS
jgi:hypothetical protein